VNATPDRTFCNQCGIDLTGHDRSDDERTPCPNCGSLTRKYEVSLAARIGMSGSLVVSPPTIDSSGQVFESTVVADQPRTEQLDVTLHFEHVVRTWHEGDGWVVDVTSPNDTPFAGTNSSLHELLRAAADAIADEID
jgi:hypothetical protein